VERALQVVDGLVAEIPPARLGSLEQAPGVIQVTRDRFVEVAEGENSTARGTSLDLVREAVGAADVPAQSTVGVAVIDTGMADLPELEGTRRFDGTGGSGLDGYGHGTHMGGIVGGKGSGFNGIAPGANLISVDVARADGSTMLIDVLIGMEWVAARRVTGNIRVLNLSLAVDPLASPHGDPMVAGINALTNAGVVVVAAAGNRGETTGLVTSPGYAANAITVGAADLHGTASVADDTVAPFSPVGSDVRRVDLLAPGVSIASLRAPGSYIDVNFPNGRLNDRLFKGSGTSQAAAVVSGVVANLLTARPGLTPAQVKSVLVSGATPLPSASPEAQGAGLVNLSQALGAPIGGSTDGGSGAGGSGDGGWVNPWTGASWGGASWGGASWGGASWGGASWGGASWGGASWGGASWGGASWGGASWGGASWGGASWGGASWGGASWGGASWGGASWGGASWGGSSWD
jgi:serine protease AprX